ncbi:hypothetical protein EsH8_IV_001175 [Colletotrichum jinshuiense]
MLAAMVAAQANHVIHGFEYVGCVNVTSDKFNAFVNFGATYTPEQCQSACAGRNYAATFADGCRCGSNIEAFAKVADALCSNPCNDDAKYGFCGYSNSQGCSYANLYEACDEFPSSSALEPTDAGPSITFSTVRLPPVTRTIKLATKSTIVAHIITPDGGSLTTSCPLAGDTSTTWTADTPTTPIIVVHTVVVHVPPQSTPALQSYGSLPPDPPRATASPSETSANPPQSAASSLSLTTLIPYNGPPIPMTSVSGNATISTTAVTPERPELRTLLPGDPAAFTATFTPAVITASPADQVKAGVAGVAMAVLVAAGI